MIMLFSFFNAYVQHSNYLIEENLLMSCLMMFLMKSKLSVMNKFYKPILLQWFQMVGLILISNQYKILLFVLQNHYFLMLFILVKNLIQLNGLQTKLFNKWRLLELINFSAVITDTASVMKAAWKIIEKNHSNIVCLGCNSHIMNLLIGDILKIDQIKFKNLYII